MDQVINEIIKFRDERDWKDSHTPSNLAKSISIESAELLEHFQWDNSFDFDEVCDELADVLIYAIELADILEVDIKDIIRKKMIKNGIKYPVNKDRK